MSYPERWHPCFFLEDALTALGVAAQVVRSAETLNCWALYLSDFKRYVVWLIDNRLPHEREKEDPAALELIGRGVVVCHAQYTDFQRIGGHWLPLAASPNFCPMPRSPKLQECAFVGFVRDTGRAQILADIGSQFTLSVGTGVFGAEAVALYNSAVVGVNIPSHYGTPYDYDINMRDFEIMACGIPLVTRNLPEMAQLGMVDNETCCLYQRDSLSVLEAIDRALAQPTIGQAGYALILARHTYRHRAEQVLQWLQE